MLQRTRPEMQPLDVNLIWVAAPSRTVARYAYDPAACRLYIEFRNRDIGYYSEVSESVLAAFQAAASKGTFIRAHLRDNPQYPWVRVAYAPRMGATSHPRQSAAQ
jgi:hypothetical protein